MDKEEIELVEEINLFLPLDPNLDYFDATASIEAMAKCMRGMYAKTVELEEALGMQSEINSRLITIIRALEARIEELEKPKSAIFLPEHMRG